jgi:hypothetical protein
MKIHHLLGAPSLILTNEENQFVDSHKEEIPIRTLYDREEVIARNLVRKGVYEISNDSHSLILKKHANNRKTPI